MIPFLLRIYAYEYSLEIFKFLSLYGGSKKIISKFILTLKKNFCHKYLFQYFIIVNCFKLINFFLSIFKTPYNFLQKLLFYTSR